MEYYVVAFFGPVGFIKPWFSVRDSKTYSQQFLTPSILEGMRQKLEVSAILRHKLTYEGFSVQMEQTHPRDWDMQTRQKLMARPRAILNRGVLLNPRLLLAFSSMEDAVQAAAQHICLCRNEDVLLPESEIQTLTSAEFDSLPGYELRFSENPENMENSKNPEGSDESGIFPVGFNRFGESPTMSYGRVEITGTPWGGAEGE